MIIVLIILCIPWLLCVRYMYDFTDHIDENNKLYKPLTILKLLTFIPIIGIIPVLFIFIVFLVIAGVCSISMLFSYWWKGINNTIKDLKK